MCDVGEMRPRRVTRAGRAARGLIGVIEKETRELHAQYLRRTSMLKSVTAACRQKYARLR